MQADFHIHSTCSDGSFTPEQLVRIFQQFGYHMLVLTDHDTIAGFQRFHEAAKACGIKTVSGVEITALYRGAEMHILAYNFDPQDEGLNELLAEIRRLRVERVLEMLEKLRKVGYHLEYEDVVAQASGEVLNRRHVALALLYRGYIKTIRDAFTYDLIADNGRAYLPARSFPPEVIIESVKKAGGIAVVAHPGTFVYPSGEVGLKESDLRYLIDCGLDGIEVFHPRHTTIDVYRYHYIARNFRLFMSFGSDYHEGEIVNIQQAIPPDFRSGLREWLNILECF